jgi:hypothetical protein
VYLGGIFAEAALGFCVGVFAASELGVFLVAAELKLEVADAAAEGAAEVYDAAGTDYEERHEEDQQDLQGADGH